MVRREWALNVNKNFLELTIVYAIYVASAYFYSIYDLIDLTVFRLLEGVSRVSLYVSPPTLNWAV